MQRTFLKMETEEQPQLKIKKPYAYDFFIKPAKLYRTQNAWTALLFSEIEMVMGIYQFPGWSSLIAFFFSGLLFCYWFVDKEINKLRAKNLAGLLTINHLVKRRLYE